jgi:beta-lactam-binding protein with PASTA domain
MTSAEAQAAATAVGLNVDLTGTTVTNNQALDDTVASQDPAGGTSVDEGSFISIVVYTYQPDVPDLTGLTVADAQTQATAVGLGTVTQVGTVETADAGLVGTIDSQTPLAGTSVVTGTNIDVIVFVAAP